MGAFGVVCLAFLAFLVPISSAAGSPAPDPPPLAVAPDPQPSKGVVTPPRRERAAPALRAPAPAVQEDAPAPSSPAVTPPAPARTKAARETPRPRRKRPAAPKPEEPVSTPAWVVTPTHSAPVEAWPGAQAAVPATVATEVLQRRRYALAGIVLALVSVGGGVLLGVGGRTLQAGA